MLHLKRLLRLFLCPIENVFRLKPNAEGYSLCESYDLKSATVNGQVFHRTNALLSIGGDPVKLSFAKIKVPQGNSGTLHIAGDFGIYNSTMNTRYPVKLCLSRG